MEISFQVMAAGAVVIIAGIIGLLLLVPTDKVKRHRLPRDAKDKVSSAPEKDWQAVSLKLERHIQALRKEIQEYQKKTSLLDRDLTVYKEKYVKLQEKLAQERDWQKKEEQGLEKRTQEILALKNEARRLEHDLSVMHSDRLRLERQLRESKSEQDTINMQRRDLELEIAKANAENERLRKEVKELKWDNVRLAEKKDAQSWIPKEDFEKLEVTFRQTEKELARLKEQLKKEVS
ncbi:MAG: hypothetical protein H6753_00150 [Candidatus Omnitrophica bacterium]|nr:hypothetical protein [Candidatus Omnitrophota bacterium]